jgi:signal transduction histidine kinase
MMIAFRSPRVHGPDSSAATRRGPSFATRLALATSLVVIAICALESWLIARGTLADLRAHLQARGRSISAALAHDAATFLTRGDLDGLGRLVAQARTQADVVSTRIFDEGGLLLASGGATGRPPVRTHETDPGEPIAVGDSVWEFHVPVASSDATATEPLGTVTVGISLALLEALQRRVVVSATVVAAFFVLVGILASVAIARALTRPLADLVSAADAVAAGHLDTRVPERIAGEMGRLACSFNAMAASLATKVHELERANHLKSEFLATVSHELRTPLNVILGYLEMLEQGAAGRLSEGQADMLSSIRRYSSLQLDLVTSVLDFTQLSSGQVTVRTERFSLAKLVEDVRALHGGTPRPDVQLVARADPRLPPLETDRIKLHQIVRNLVDNAVKFTQTGRITIDARPGVTPDRVLVTVSDTGPGVSAHDLPHVFDPFHQLGDSSTRDTGGVGLGLSIVAHLVRVLGGSISVVSEVGRGSAFRVELPVRFVAATAGGEIPRLAAAS